MTPVTTASTASTATTATIHSAATTARIHSTTAMTPAITAVAPATTTTTSTIHSATATTATVARIHSTPTTTPATTATIAPLVCVDDYETEARSKLPPVILGYYSTGSLGQVTLKENPRAMNRWYILPRMLRDVSQRSMATEVLGMRLQMPVAVSPTAMQKMAHPDGECASARGSRFRTAVERLGSVFTLGSIATSSIEEVAQAAPDALKFFQLYIYRDRTLVEELVHRAERAGYRAIVITIDSPVLGIRRINTKNLFTLPPHLTLANLTAAYSKAQKATPSNRSILQFGGDQFVQYNNWDHLEWLVKLTSLPVVAKGVLTGEDSRRALGAGVAAVWVSNHGGRQVDTAPPTIEALPHVVAEVAGRCPVFVDGGFTQGTEVFKALALGARLVFVGRPVLWGLACGGEEGVYHLLSIIRDELDNVMANTGCRNVADIDSSMVVRKELYCRL